MTDLRQYAEFNTAFADAVREGRRRDAALKRSRRTGWPAEFTGYGEPQAARLLLNVEAIYNEVK